MPAITTIIAGVSALATVATVKTAKDAAGAQAAAQAKQQATAKSELDAALAANRANAQSLADSKTRSREASKLGSQDQGLKVADVELGTSKASDELLKRTKSNVAKKPVQSSGTKVGGLKKGTATKVGGL